jgi:inner membrane protein
MALQFGASNSVGIKAVLIGTIVLLLLIPLTLLRGVITERSSLRELAYAKVAEGWGGNIVSGGPVLIIPTERTVLEGGITKIVRDDIYLLPSLLDVDVELKLDSEPRYVGIYAVPVYLATLDISGQFDFAALQPLLGRSNTTYLWNQSRLRLPLSQVRSLREVRQARFADQDITLGPAGPGLYRGIEAAIDLTGVMSRAAHAFHFQTVLAGSRDLSVLPVGSKTTVTLQSDWPHPSFQGAFLPVERNISAAGFQARWQVLELNRSYRQAWLESEMDEATFMESAFGVGLYQAVDIYQRGERAVKYAVLFIALTFLTFFAWEQVSTIRIHPLQYLLVGLALSVFYLLLIALSEHLAFLWAYLISALALVMLIGIYVAGAFHSRKRGVFAGTAMSAVYGLLYVLVLSEDYALLLGAITLFVGLAAVMLVTRKIDWYAGRAAEAGATDED